MIEGGIAFFFGVVLIFGPFAYAIFILKKLDAAAKQRKQSGGNTQFRFMIVDFFSLILLVQLPFNFVSLELGDVTSIVLIVISLIAVLLVWFTTIKTVSQAGISTFGWRALVSMILIPTMYIGSFYFGIASLNMIWGDMTSPRAIVWLVASFVGMVLSLWIVNGAVEAGAEVAVDPVVVEAVTSTTDPFAD